MTWELALVVLILQAIGCGPAKVVNVSKRYEQLRPIYEATRSTYGREEIQPLLARFRVPGAVTVVSQEVPFSVDQIWAVGAEEARELPDDNVTIDLEARSVSLDLTRVAQFLGHKLYVQSATKLVPTPYGTTVIHYAVTRWESGNPGFSPVGAGIGRVPEDETVRSAVVEIGLYMQKVIDRFAPGLPMSRFPERIKEMRAAYEVARAAPADLQVTADFDDRRGVLPNGRIDPGESSVLRVTVTNDGRGAARGVAVEAHSTTTDLEIPAVTAVGELASGGATDLAIPLETGLRIPAGVAVITLDVRESRGFDAKPVEVVVPVAAMTPPALRITSVTLDDGRESGGDDDGRLGTGERAALVATVENSGAGAAVDVSFEVAVGTEGVVAPQPLRIAEIPSHTARTVRIPLTATRSMTSSNVDLQLVAADGRGEVVGAASWQGSLPAIVRSALLEVVHRVFDGDSPRSVGDRDGVANNGERLEIEVQVLNHGRLAAEDVSLKLVPELSALSIEPSQVEIGTLPARSDGPAARFVIDLPRSFRGPGPLRTEAVVRNRFDPPVRELIEMPFEFRSPDLRLGPTAAVPVVAGHSDQLRLTLVNLGSLEAEQVRVVARPASDRVVILDADGRPTSARTFTQASVPPGTEVTEYPVTVFVKRGGGTGEERIEVLVEQAGFDSTRHDLILQVADESPAQVSVGTRGEQDGPTLEHSADDRIAPALWITEPVKADGDHDVASTVTVEEGRIRVHGRTRDAEGIYRVLVGGREIGVQGDGEFSAWVRLAYGVNLVPVEAEDTQGNRSRVNLRIERKGAVVRHRLRRDRAVLFVTSHYDRWPSIYNPVPDGKALRSVLESLYGFQVELVVDPTLSEILQTLRRYASHDPGPEDQLLVFFAGHGSFDDRFGEGYVVARDSLRSDEVGRTYLPHSELATILNHLPYRHLLVVLDVCFGGTFDRRLSEAARRGENIGQDVSRQEFIHRRLALRSRLYLTAGGKEYVPDGVPGRHSPFLRRVLEALNGLGGEDRILTAGELFGHLERLRPEPRAGTFGDSEPGGGFLFVATGE